MPSPALRFRSSARCFGSLSHTSRCPTNKNFYEDDALFYAVGKLLPQRAFAICFTTRTVITIFRTRSTLLKGVFSTRFLSFVCARAQHFVIYSPYGLIGLETGLTFVEISYGGDACGNAREGYSFDCITQIANSSSIVKGSKLRNTPRSHNANAFGFVCFLPYSSGNGWVDEIKK